MLAVRVKQVDVVAGRAAGRHIQARAHFLGKDVVPQALRGPNILFSASPNDLKTGSRSCMGLVRAWMK